MAYLYIIIGAVAGAPLRYFIAGKVQDATTPTFPFGTLVVNVSACLAIGLLTALAEDRQLLNREARLLLITGFLGAYSTFSTLGLETYNLITIHDIARAVAYAVASVVVGILAVYIGTVVGRAV
ncbi:MAG TPA: fluoride efflux transporter CrcB [Tepidiformaceae bacterium]|nr:fluoride efflux transporter CrcB [Tepidiformaceae bacterium]